MRGDDGLVLAEDDRAKIPFAVIGVLLLVTSVSIVVVLETRSEPEVDTDAAQAYDRTSSAVRSVIQGATTSALQQSAAQPVTDPNGSTSVGQALAAGPSGGSDADEVFSRYVQLRVYLALQERLGHANQSIRQDTVTRVSMPEHDDPADAIDAITLHVGGDRLDYGDPGGADLPYGAVRVTVPDVQIEVVEDGHVVGTRTQDYTVTVGSTVFALHHRTTTYEDALNTDLGDDEGFARHLAARLTRVAWQRGHAQANGSPVAQVLGERHLETLANDALFATQRAAFGAEDPYADRQLVRSYGCMLAADHTAVYDDPSGGSSDLGPVLDRVDEPGFCAGAHSTYADLGNALEAATAPNYTRLAGTNDYLEATSTVDLDEPSRTAVGDLAANGAVSDAIDRVYTVEVSADENLTEEVIPAAGDVEPPGPGWTVEDTDLLSVAGYRVHRVDASRVVRPNVTGVRQSYYRFDVTYSADVNREITWSNGDQRQSVTGGAILLINGSITIRGHYSPDSEVADRGIVHDYVHGPFGSNSTIYDTNFESVPGDAVEAIFTNVSDVQRAEQQLAQSLSSNADRILSGDDLVDAVTTDGRSVRIHPEPADREELRGWLVQDLNELERNTSAVSVTVDRHEYLDDDSPLTSIAAEIESDDRVYAHVENGHYTNVPDRVRAEVRLQYMQALRERVNATIRRHERQTDRLDGQIQRHAGIGLENATRFTRGQLNGTPLRPTGYDFPDAMLDGIRIVPHGEPTYLTFDRIDATQVPAVDSGPHDFAPTAGRDRNVYARPARDVTTSPDAVSLRTAGTVLRAAQATAATTGDPNWDGGTTEALERSLEADLETIERRAAASASRPFDHITRSEMRDAIDRALSERGPTSRQAIELARGETGVERVATAVARSFDRPADRQYGYYGTDYYDHLEASVRYGLRDAVGDGTVANPTARRTVTLGTAVRSELDSESRAAIQERLELAAREGLGNDTTTATSEDWLASALGNPAPNTVAAGTTIVDRPAMNVLTANLWNVHLRGTYARFTVTATGDRVTGTGRVTYVREDSAVRLAYDGTEQRIGRIEPVEFSANASVLVAVPPDSYGVGDRTTATDWCSDTYDTVGPIVNRRPTGCGTP